MEEHKKCDPIIHRFYFVKFRASYKLEKQEADNQYHLTTLAQSRINKEIDQRKADERQIHQKLMWFSQCDHHIDWRKNEIKHLEAIIGKPEPRLPMNSVCLTSEKDGQWDRKRCQKRLIKKDRMDMEVQEELQSLKKSAGMTLCGTHDLNHLIRLEEIEIIERDLMGRKRRVTRLKSELEFVRKNISCLQKELQDVTSKRLKAYESAYELGEQKKEVKSYYKEYQLLIAYAKSLAQKGDVVGLKQASDTQVEGFMRHWNDSQVFRNDYERRKMLSRVSRDIV